MSVAREPLEGCVSGFARALPFFPAVLPQITDRNGRVHVWAIGSASKNMLTRNDHNQVHNFPSVNDLRVPRLACAHRT